MINFERPKESGNRDALEEEGNRKKRSKFSGRFQPKKKRKRLGPPEAIKNRKRPRGQYVMSEAAGSRWYSDRATGGVVKSYSLFRRIPGAAGRKGKEENTNQRRRSQNVAHGWILEGPQARNPHQAYLQWPSRKPAVANKGENCQKGGRYDRRNVKQPENRASLTCTEKGTRGPKNRKGKGRQKERGRRTAQ